MGDDDAKHHSDRRNKGRRKLDIEMENRLTALELGQKVGGDMLTAHLRDCANNYRELKASVDKVVAWSEPQIAKAQAKADTWKKISEKVETDGMVFVIKTIVVLTATAIAYGIVPAGRAILEHLLKSVGG